MTWALVPTCPYSPRGRKATVKKKNARSVELCWEVDDLGSCPYSPRGRKATVKKK